MTIYQICFKPLVVPPSENEYVTGRTYQAIAATEKTSLDWNVRFRGVGDYKIEYWAVNDMGTETTRNTAEFTTNSFTPPSPVSGASFEAAITPSSQNVVLQKDGIRIIFSRKQECFGANFDWSDLDLTGLRLGKSAGRSNERFLSIAPGSWLSKKLNNERCLIEVQVNEGERLFIKSFLLTQPNGALKNKLPSCYRSVVARSWKEAGKLCFLLRQMGLFTIEL